jgi:hypothetical protein
LNEIRSPVAGGVFTRHIHSFLDVSFTDGQILIEHLRIRIPASTIQLRKKRAAMFGIVTHGSVVFTTFLVLGLVQFTCEIDIVLLLGPFAFVFRGLEVEARL